MGRTVRGSGRPCGDPVAAGTRNAGTFGNNPQATMARAMARIAGAGQLMRIGAAIGARTAGFEFIT